MAVPIQFDANQPHQLRAVQAITDLFAGQLLAPAPFEISPTGQGVMFTDAVVANAVDLDAEAVTRNLIEIQAANDIPTEFRMAEGDQITELDFTIEMETGTGKTYAYLRTALELRKLYGFTKFVVVVPSVAIREGVLSNLRLLREHFDLVYGGLPYGSRVYRADSPGDLRAFATSSQLEILIINIDSFNRSDANLIYRGRDATGQIPPIDFIRATNPIVILDEPQQLEGAAAKAGIAALHPLIKLRYSATHRQMPNPVFRLTPVDAYEQGLVKQIEVWSITEDPDLNRPYVSLDSVTATRGTVTARATIDVAGAQGTARRSIVIKADRAGVLPDLFQASGRREQYRGYVVEDIRADLQEVGFGNGVRLRVGQAVGADTSLVQRTQITTAVELHLQREQDLHRRFVAGELPSRLKPLTLFFIDHVANYHPPDAPFRHWFEEAYERLAPRYPDLGLPLVADVHGGYFSEDRHGPKDTTGQTKADDEAFELIMRRKDVLMSPEQPMRFIFSHSALREGWDNPNVFVIATLNESRSEVRKRQEIGRGLRLPVMESGERCMDPEVARLSVVANESYDTFASGLQREIEEETGSTFAKAHIKNARLGRPVRIRDSALIDPDFIALWDRIKVRTRYRVEVNSQEVIRNAAVRLADEPTLVAPALRVTGAEIAMTETTGVIAERFAVRTPTAAHPTHPIPDLLGHLAERVTLSRSSVVEVLVASGRLGEVTVNPHRFIEQAATAIAQALAEAMLAGIKYTPRTDADGVYDMSLLTEREATTFAAARLDLGKSAFSEVQTGSRIEEAFARALQDRTDVLGFIKLPWWFKVETPLGNYNPDWAIVLNTADGARCYLVRETKGTDNFARLPEEQRLKIQYGEQHFEAIEVDYSWVRTADDLAC